MSPARRTATPSAMVWTRGSSHMQPCSMQCFSVGAPSGSTPITFIEGLNALAAIAIPETRPPPPTGTSIHWQSGSSFSISRAIVPWPAITASSSKGCINRSPFSFSRRRASAYASSYISPARTTSAPNFRCLQFLSGELF
jgi:hypothetical protein